MTVATIFAGLLPIMIGHGAGSEVMRRIAAPMIGGMITAQGGADQLLGDLVPALRQRDAFPAAGLGAAAPGRH